MFAWLWPDNRDVLRHLCALRDVIPRLYQRRHLTVCARQADAVKQTGQSPPFCQRCSIKLSTCKSGLHRASLVLVSEQGRPKSMIHSYADHAERRPENTLCSENGTSQLWNRVNTSPLDGNTSFVHKRVASFHNRLPPGEQSCASHCAVSGLLRYWCVRALFWLRSIYQRYFGTVLVTRALQRYKMRVLLIHRHGARRRLSQRKRVTTAARRPVPFLIGLRIDGHRFFGRLTARRVEALSAMSLEAWICNEIRVGTCRCLLPPARRAAVRATGSNQLRDRR